MKGISRRVRPDARRERDGRGGTKEKGPNPRLAAPGDARLDTARRSRQGRVNLARGRATGEDLLESMKQRLSGSTFRVLNEQLYTTPSAFAGQLLRDRETFAEYHDGYRRQLELWPTRPTDVILEALRTTRRGRFVQGVQLPPEHKSHGKAAATPDSPNWLGIPRDFVVADLGCGDAAIAAALGATHTVHSFDFYPVNERVTVADMAALPLPDRSVHVAVFSLSLMSTNWPDFLREAARILKPKVGLLKILEVRSRFPDPARFVRFVESMGFNTVWYGVVDEYFCAFDFEVQGEASSEAERRNQEWRNRNAIKTTNADEVLLPCLYKRR
jgi:SAM-dependent methyltransferase